MDMPEASSFSNFLLDDLEKMFTKTPCYKPHIKVNSQRYRSYFNSVYFP